MEDNQIKSDRKTIENLLRNLDLTLMKRLVWKNGKIFFSFLRIMFPRNHEFWKCCNW